MTSDQASRRETQNSGARRTRSSQRGWFVMRTTERPPTHVLHAHTRYIGTCPLLIRVTIRATRCYPGNSFCKQDNVAGIGAAWVVGQEYEASAHGLAAVVKILQSLCCCQHDVGGRSLPRLRHLRLQDHIDDEIPLLPSV